VIRSKPGIEHGLNTPFEHTYDMHLKYLEINE
jgi:hypothetical protein